jgi:hypothetical protein
MAASPRELPPEVARALGRPQLPPQPAWQRWGPLGLLVTGGGFLVGGTLLGIRRAAAREEELDGGARGAPRARAPRRAPPPTAPAAAAFSPAALAGKALLYGTALALGGTAAGCAAFCAWHGVRRVEDVSPALRRVGAAAAGWLGVAPPAPFETDADFDDDGGGGAPLPAAFAGAPAEVAGFVRRQVGARERAAAQPPPPAAAAGRPAAPADVRFIDATDAKYLSADEAAAVAQFLRGMEGAPAAAAAGRSSPAAAGSGPGRPPTSQQPPGGV